MDSPSIVTDRRFRKVRIHSIYGWDDYCPSLAILDIRFSIVTLPCVGDLESSLKCKVCRPTSLLWISLMTDGSVCLTPCRTAEGVHGPNLWQIIAWLPKFTWPLYLAETSRECRPSWQIPLACAPSWQLHCPWFSWVKLFGQQFKFNDSKLHRKVYCSIFIMYEHLAL